MEIKYLALVPVAIVVGYILWRLMTFGAAKSYFQAKLWFYKKQKEDR